MKSARRLLVAFIAACLSAGPVLADWTCSCCGRTYPVNPGHSAYEDNWIQLHRNACCVSRSGGGQSMVPSGPSPEQLQKQRRQAERQRQLEAAEAEERQRKLDEETKRLEFERRKQEAVGELKGASGNKITLKSGTTFFGIKGNPDTNLQLKEVGPAEPAMPTAWKQLNAAAYLAGVAISGLEKDPIDIEDVRFICDQAGKALGGERLSVQVPEAAPMPRLSENPPPAAAKFYETVVKVIGRQAARIEKDAGRIRQAEEKKKAAESEILERKNEVSRLKADAKAPDAVQPSQNKRIANPALADALAALALARQSDANAAVQERAARADQADAQAGLRKLGQIAKTVAANPAAAGRQLQQLQSNNEHLFSGISRH